MVEFINSREEMENLIVTMNIEGWSIRALTKHFKVSRNTVRRILRNNKKRRTKGNDNVIKNRNIKRASKLDEYNKKINELLEEFPKITGQRIFEEIRAKGYKGSISLLRERIRLLRPKPKKDPIVRFETEAGEQGQMDWSPYTINFAKTGKTEVLCFSYILGFSRRHYIDFTLNRKFHTLIRRHQDAFEYYNGVPKHCLYDGEKTIILRWEAGRPVYNPSFIAFITHYNCRPFGCRPGRPETKGKVEAPFKYIENNLLNGRKFQDLEDLRATACWWLKEKSDKHTHNTTRKPPIELFMETERSALQPLPLHPYDTSEVKLIVCPFDGFLRFETNMYSLPYEYVGEIITLKATETEIFVYSPNIKLIAHHERLPKGAGQKIEKPEHREFQKIKYGLEPVKERFLKLGNAAYCFLEGLKSKFPHNCGFHARYILQLKEQYTSDDIGKALEHANNYYAFDGKAIERILQAKFKPRTLESTRNARASELLKKSLPEIKQRPLDNYSKLLLKLEK